MKKFAWIFTALSMMVFAGAYASEADETAAVTDDQNVAEEVVAVVTDEASDSESE